MLFLNILFNLIMFGCCGKGIRILTKPAESLRTFVDTSIELHCSLEGAVGESISLTEDQFEVLQTVQQDISDRTNVDSDESDQELEEQIAKCLNVCIAAGGFEFPQHITTFSDFKAESKVTEVCIRA